MSKPAIAIVTFVAASALAVAGCTKPEGDGHTSAEETGYEASGGESADPTEQDDVHGHSGTAGIDNDEEEGPASPAY